MSPPRIGVLGIGNLLLSDEGFGPHVLQRLEDDYLFPENVQLMDAGTASIYMAPFIEECDYIYVFDVVDTIKPPGTLCCFTSSEVRAGTIQTKMSPHQLGLLEMMDICAMRGRIPEEVEYLCVVPASIEPGLELTPLVAAQLDPVITLLFEKLERHHVQVVRKERSAFAGRQRRND